ncbi:MULTISPECIES: bifunctional indole-3-glycerol-phosphate synthase TrpC/phosphoribosylanthranilate isomerase TrpF [unclassified Arsukibacterium]|uniref:bifunctional indole-3-glycerol-phosphate synthase TrpC/phosphoribosylanthranilate isomerase TrpF n=1 Tax=unclassified Arsukibacterium TaxID=2635278 RepID=UPI000C55D30D|nr:MULTISPECIES: bifunctional indole-3-glycerol-phosphate synthase TrpC/phosphoribosylanthranilate isomerase TrpF [unclassified Arsukibacterium]MBM35060.1 bifunctional indole-3-glycerol-phosphate synthase TrpC/phosphoribosylanthranilate isomerase TrpF [Rheinheimera sp.]HAW92390.1 bifunctional indole-3-glycerol phosphate synthase/phosphoribosylanthranilate isomerase [Candidatus Azambacteria bacterium]|tara:strand:- start:10187 stop:11677 length:1491 start_codon:yes stop_codon:yes gene_type:complete
MAEQLISEPSTSDQLTGVLAKIIEHKKAEVAGLQLATPLEQFIEQVVPSNNDFLAALQQPGSRFILECKKASPSKGLIRQHFDLAEISQVYNQFADCISVLTDEHFFQGSYQNLAKMRQLSDKPLLHKDFIIEPYQIYLGRLYGADAVLLMLSVLTDAVYQSLAQLAAKLNMTVLTEVSNEAETRRAVALGANLIGINNRNLRDLSTNLDTSFKLAALIPDDVTVVSESGIYTNQQVRYLQPVADAFLVGSSLMAEANLASAARKLIVGEHKVCGLTRPEDVKAAYAAGAYYGGLIFAPVSKRYISPERASELVQAAPLNFVGVFVDAPVSDIATIAQQLKLHAVQLHGSETDQDIKALRSALPVGCQIWKAYRVADTLPEFTKLADRLLLDSYHPAAHGGSGQVFNWQLVQQPLEKLTVLPVMLAGGLNPDNVSQALALPVAGLDLNSGLESAPGIKDSTKIQAAFSAISAFQCRSALSSEQTNHSKQTEQRVVL